MDGDPIFRLLISLLVIFGSAFFVGAEYALISCRRSRFEALARRGNGLAKRVLKALDNINRHIAGVQIGISMCGIGAGSVTEPYVTGLLHGLFKNVPNRGVTFTVISLLVVTFLMVVIGELVPKYVVLQRTDKLALYLIPPLNILVGILYPLIWVIDRTGAGILLLFGIRMDERRTDAIPKEEMLLLLKAQSAEGILEDVHAKMLARAFQLDKLDAKDVMIHRMDIKWIDLSTAKEKLRAAVAAVPNTRMPVCRGDIDDVAGILYLHDFVQHWDDVDFNLERILRPVVAVPENLTIDKLIERMQESRTQILIVVDEFGGTSGLITLEDIVEEVFGELEDRIETERPTIELFSSGRVSARAEVRFDELISKLGLESDEEPSTDALAQIFVDKLGRVPKIGDTVDIPIGIMRVENMARRRITRVSIQLNRETQEAADVAHEKGGETANPKN